MSVPVTPSAGLGAEWQIEPVQPAEPSGGSSFSGALGQAMQSLQADQAKAAEAAQGLAAGTATDQTSAVMALERARLSMQLASQIRTKAVESFSDVMRTQV